MIGNTERVKTQLIALSSQLKPNAELNIGFSFCSDHTAISYEQYYMQIRGMQELLAVYRKAGDRCLHSMVFVIPHE